MQVCDGLWKLPLTPFAASRPTPDMIAVRPSRKPCITPPHSEHSALAFFSALEKRPTMDPTAAEIAACNDSERQYAHYSQVSSASKEHPAMDPTATEITACNDTECQDAHDSQDIPGKHSPLLRLPDELLAATASYLGNDDRVCLQSACKQLYQLSTISVQELTADERRRFSKALWRDAYNTAVEAEDAGHFSTRPACRVCKATHPVDKFSETELAIKATHRGCILAERRLVLCEHRSLSLLELKARFQDKSRDELLSQKLGAEGSLNGSEIPVISYVCNHHSHKNEPLGGTGRSLPSLDVAFDSRGASVSISARAYHKLGSNLWRSVQKLEFAQISNTIRARLRSLDTRLCPHTATADGHITSVFTRMFSLDLACRKYGPGRIPPAGSCRHPGCTMSFEFHRQVTGG